MEWKLYIKNIASEWLAVGMADICCLYSNRRFTELGHKSFLVSANGITYSSDILNDNGD